MCVETLRTGLSFLRWLIWGVTCLGLLSIMNVFPSISLETPINVCWNPLNRACFYKTIDLRDHMSGFTLKMRGFPSICLEPINVCWNPQNRAQFSEMMDLRDHMPKFTLNMNVFPSICMETPLMCIETHRTGLDFLQDDGFEGSHV